MRSIRHSLRLTAGVLAGALLLLLLAALQPAAAQTSTPSVPAATAASATSTTTSTPTPSAPAATPEPTKTLPQLIDTLIKGDAPTETAGQLLGRYSIPLAALVLVAAVLGFFAWRYFSGLGAAVEDVGKTHGSDMLKARAEERERLQAEQRRREAETQARDDEQHKQEAEKQARDSGVAAYLDWLQDELKYLPRIPIRSTDQRGQLLLTEVYVPLRVVERDQI